MIKVPYPRLFSVLTGALVILLLDRYLSDDSWLHSLRDALILVVIFSVINWFQWHRESRERR